MYVLGIDGGGTKTEGVIASSRGEIVAKATVGASNPNSVQKSDIETELAKLIEFLRKQNNNIFPLVKRVFAGISGAEHPSARREMERIITSLLPGKVGVTVNNDAITALYSGTLGEPGIVQIAGTGSITFGLNEKGVLDRVGGWGYLIGEKGSGFALGSEGLETAFLAHDGLGEGTELYDLILDHFKVQSLPDIIQIVYHGKNTKELIASLSKIVVKAADNGDRDAKNIIRKNALHMGESISCLIRKLFAEQNRAEDIPVVLTGGLFNRLDLFRDSMEEVLIINNINARLVIPKMEPVGGAVIAAFREEDVEINKDFLKFFVS